MVLDFKQEEIQEEEKESRNAFSGYFSPSGKLINFNISGEETHHQDASNPVSQAFMKYISYKKDEDGTVYRGYPYFEEPFEVFYRRILRDIERLETFIHSGFGDQNDHLELDMLNFFKNAYRDNKFFESIGRIVTMNNDQQLEFDLKCRKKYKDPVELEIDKAQLFIYYLLKIMKDVCIMYLGYDSVESKEPNGNKIIVNKDGEYDLDFLAHPRVISTSVDNAYDRFYNYLLMDWRVDKMPRYYYDIAQGKYVLLPLNIAIEKETMLREEIESIKKLTPREERYKYFRE